MQLGVKEVGMLTPKNCKARRKLLRSIGESFPNIFRELRPLQSS